jgi:hypothetical protein
LICVGWLAGFVWVGLVGWLVGMDGWLGWMVSWLGWFGDRSVLSYKNTDTDARVSIVMQYLLR